MSIKLHSKVNKKHTHTHFPSHLQNPVSRFVYVYVHTLLFFILRKKGLLSPFVFRFSTDCTVEEVLFRLFQFVFSLGAGWLVCVCVFFPCFRWLLLGPRVSLILNGQDNLFHLLFPKLPPIPHIKINNTTC